MLCLDDNIQTVDHLLSSNKNTLAPASDKYDAITISAGQDKQVCFRNYSSEPKDRYAYKEWFNAQKANWGRAGKKLFDRWARENTVAIAVFVSDFEKAYARLKKKY